jgi:hypothetical protein
MLRDGKHLRVRIVGQLGPGLAMFWELQSARSNR